MPESFHQRSGVCLVIPSRFGDQRIEFVKYTLFINRVLIFIEFKRINQCSETSCEFLVFLTSGLPDFSGIRIIKEVRSIISKLICNQFRSICLQLLKDIIPSEFVSMRIVENLHKVCIPLR